MTKEAVERFPTAASAPASPRHQRHEVLMRRTGIVVLVVVVLVGLLGFLGPASRTVAGSGPPGDLEMEYHSITRPGVDTEIVLTLRPERPSAPVVLTIDQDVLETLGIDLFAPEPVEQRAEGSRVLLEFATTGADTLDIRISGRTPTTQPPGRTTWQLQWLADGTPAATLDATTWVVP